MLNDSDREATVLRSLSGSILVGCGFIMRSLTDISRFSGISLGSGVSFGRDADESLTLGSSLGIGIGIGFCSITGFSFF